MAFTPLATKLHPPRPCPTLVPRPRLNALLSGAVDVLLSRLPSTAPHGSATVPPMNLDGRPVAELRGDLTLFLLYAGAGSRV